MITGGPWASVSPPRKWIRRDPTPWARMPYCRNGSRERRPRKRPVPSALPCLTPRSIMSFSCFLGLELMLLDLDRLSFSAVGCYCCWRQSYVYSAVAYLVDRAGGWMRAPSTLCLTIYTRLLLVIHTRPRRRSQRSEYRSIGQAYTVMDLESYPA